MNNYIIYSIIASFLLSMAGYIIFIPILTRLRSYQYIREEGPKSHKIKELTPTMGGLVFITITIITFLLSKLIFEERIDFSIDIALIFLPIVGFGIIGLIDDLIVVVKKNNTGLEPRFKFLLQVLISVIYFYIYLKVGHHTSINMFGMEIDLKGFYGILILLMLVSTSNAVNLTDGLDGLATGISIIVLIGLAVLINRNTNPDLLIYTVCLIGSLLGFLVFNFNPAKIFMGDTGSLALGASMASIAILGELEILLIFLGMTYILETLSVIVQVAYFKKTNGKRIFRMTPIHHHFELGGMKEKEVVLMFYLLTVAFTLIGVFLGLNYF